ncbi:hypothetical protein DIURU_005736 [Diutina rugosa]|uniref:Kinesin motor domain-containing protein n=1 Tax=Diutina rugosa TaxID=5481 RepID=A0A642UCJ8_DIURU|nr:uncharacterized protein DIURU_005736 [Diutina rugosa]KAA8896724.1 hypothetical protein DIURU_005736 [Diutina rugosa]
MEDNQIKTIVRVRPRLSREQDQRNLISMTAATTTIEAPPQSAFHARWKQGDTASKTYTFDKSVWSCDPESANFIDNKEFYQLTGRELLDHAFQGYNVCLLAYGQTGSGKTYTMSGTADTPGLIPQLVRDIIGQKEILVGQGTDCTIRISAYEVHNEKVHDLLGVDDKVRLKVREHPQTGPYVEGCNEIVVNSEDDFTRHFAKTLRNRTTASTLMNDQSSRSHAIISLTIKQTIYCSQDNELGDAKEEIVSNMKLVDLAGSERLDRTKLHGQQDRVREGSLINSSLTTLGRCVNSLASADNSVVPYRDSVLTYLLRENLGGNSKTSMVFCISPCDFEETYHTLTYASQVKKIKTKARSNAKKLSVSDWTKLRSAEDNVIARLRQQVEQLTSQSTQQQQSAAQLISTLENELERVQFENKFIRQQVSAKNSRLRQALSVVKAAQQSHASLDSHWDLGRRRCRSRLTQLTQDATAKLEDIDECLARHHPRWLDQVESASSIN